MYKLVRYLKFIVLLNIYNQDAKASHLKLRKNVPLLITIFRVKQYSFTSQTILFHSWKSNIRRMKGKNSGFRSLEDEACQ